MPVVSPEKLVALQRNADQIRNICILAHVDHGKTSLSDGLIATNGIISPKLAGKIRYLDSRPDEQLRGITMESSAISLFFSMLQRSGERGEYLINLIDSPGHVDFSSEVSTASRLCDGAVVLVDAVEGVCSQTVTVLRQTWIEKLKPLLVINKIDRLITELEMSAAEAYTHMSQLIEQVNAVMGSFVLGERMEYDLKWRETLDQRVAAASNKLQEDSDAVGSTVVDGLKHSDDAVDTSTPAEYEDKDDEDVYFAPEKNNVIFSSAIDGWAFTVNQFAGIWEKKLGMKREVLQKVLWGDFYYDPKSKKVLAAKHLKGRHLKPMFVQFVLDSIWQVYEATTGGHNGKGDTAMTEKIVKALNITIPAYVLRSRDPRAILTQVFQSWIPLSTALLVSVIEHLPSPIESQNTRMEGLLDSSPGGSSVDSDLRSVMTKFSQERDAPVVAYVSKMVAIPESELPRNKQRGGNAMTAEEARELARKKRAEFAKARAAEEDAANGLANALATASIGDDEDLNGSAEPQTKEDPEHMIGFARLYSGTLNVGDEIYVLPPKWNPANPNFSTTPQKIKVEALYLLMGRSLESLQSVPAGSIFGVEGLAGKVLKNATLCSQPSGGPNLAGVNLGGDPIVRVAVEPENPADLEKMIRGLKQLEQSDPCAIYEVLESGEHVLATAGELHLERCLKDLRERFARCEVQAGEAIVPYRESIVSAEEMREPQNKDLPRGTVIAETTSKQIQVRMRVRPLPQQVTEFLLQNAAAIKKLHFEREEGIKTKDTDSNIGDGDEEDDAHAVAKTALEEAELAEAADAMSVDDFKEKLKAAFAESKTDKTVWKEAIDHIAAFGPRRCGPNVLFDMTEGGTCDNILHNDSETNGADTNKSALTQRTFADKIIYAFQLATYQGPLCHEPTQGVAVFLEKVTISNSTTDGGEDTTTTSSTSTARLSGELIKTTRDAIRTGFLDWSPRILLAMYSIEIQASTEVLGKVYGVVTRRRGRIVSEAMKEGTPFFTILSLLPVAESFGFAEEMRKRTAGHASPQLIFAGFELLEEGDGRGDPFWVPSTEEQLEDLGELADRENLAKRYVDGVRRRKGLFVRGVARVAEKQKTLKR